MKINGERHYLWRALDHEGEVLESFVTKTRDKKAAVGSIIEPRASTYHSNVGSALRSASDACAAYKNSHPSTPPSQTTSTRTAAFQPDPTSNGTETSLSMNGGCFVPNKFMNTSAN